ncbi:hypothetical protein LTR17_019835 [Elasticomyces elasticus]|nr:hypothetical protein LTR17_019835 [Elasticomyces elasticus]
MSIVVATARAVVDMSKPSLFGFAKHLPDLSLTSKPALLDLIGDMDIYSNEIDQIDRLHDTSRLWQHDIEAVFRPLDTSDFAPRRASSLHEVAGIVKGQSGAFTMRVKRPDEARPRVNSEPLTKRRRITDAVQSDIQRNEKEEKEEEEGAGYEDEARTTPSGEYPPRVPTPANGVPVYVPKPQRAKERKGEFKKSIEREEHEWYAGDWQGVWELPKKREQETPESHRTRAYTARLDAKAAKLAGRAVL